MALALRGYLEVEVFECEGRSEKSFVRNCLYVLGAFAVHRPILFCV